MKKGLIISLIILLLAGVGGGAFATYKYAAGRFSFDQKQYTGCEGTVTDTGITGCRFKSSDEAVAAIDENGVITFVAPGETVIKACFGPVFFKAAITVSEHEFSEATCLLDGVCSLCGKVNEPARGHSMAEPTCVLNSRCRVCGYDSGEGVLGHDFTERTCTEDAVCKRCGESGDKAYGHDFSEPTCFVGAVCRRCNEAGEGPLGHDWSEPTCTEGSICKRCELEGDEKALGHSLLEATCTEPQICERCGAEKGDPKGHKYKAVCGKETYCDVCNVKVADKLDHVWADATCTKAQTCKNCKKTTGDPLGHSATEATCTSASYCTRCNKKLSGTLSHNYICVEQDDGYHYTCAMCGKTYFEAKVNASAYVNEVFNLVNKEREANGLPALRLNGTLCNIAAVRAQECSVYFSHTRPDGTKWITLYAPYGYSYSYAGENIAAGQSTPAQVMNDWMNSEGHRANILKAEYTEIGIGVYEDANGRLHWSQNFGTPK